MAIAYHHFRSVDNRQTSRRFQNRDSLPFVCLIVVGEFVEKQTSTCKAVLECFHRSDLSAPSQSFAASEVPKAKSADPVSLCRSAMPRSRGIRTTSIKLAQASPFGGD